MEQNLLSKVLEWSWVIVVGMISVFWKINTDEHKRHREIQKVLFDRLKEHERQDETLFRDLTKQLTDGLASVTQQMTANHVELLRAMPKRKGDE